jgi:hypothetical protein
VIEQSFAFIYHYCYSVECWKYVGMLSVVTVYHWMWISLKIFGRFSSNEHLQDVQIDLSSKILSMYFNLKPESCRMLYIPETIESVQLGSKYLQILYSQGNPNSYWVCSYCESNVINVNNCFNSHHLYKDHRIDLSKLYLHMPHVTFKHVQLWFTCNGIHYINSIRKLNQNI